MAEEQVLYLNVDNVYGADELGLPYRDIVAEGVVGTGDFLVSQRAAGANMSVDVAAGACWIKGDDDANLQPTYRYREPAITNVSITAADPTDPRIDRVVAEVLDDTFAGVSKLGRIRVIAGTPTTGATLSNLSGAASVPNNALLLANVLVSAGDTSITNAEIDDQRVSASPGLRQPYCIASLPSPQSVNNSSFATVSLTAESADVEAEAMHDTSTNPERVTIRTPGLYLVTGHLEWAVSAAGSRELQVSKNGSQVEYDRRPAATSFATTNKVVFVAPLVAGDYLTLTAWQDSGGALNVGAAFLRAARIGPS